MQRQATHLYSKQNPRETTLAVLAGLGAGAVWGLAFLVPKILQDYPPAVVSFGRFLFFGGFSVLILFAAKAKVPKVRQRASSAAESASRPLHRWTPKLIGRIGFLAAMGNSFYYVALVTSVQKIGVAIPSLIVGLLPITVPLASSRGRLPRNLYLPLAGIFVGMVLINVDSFHSQPDGLLMGVVLALGSLLMWTYYSIANAKFLKSRPDISSLESTSLQGIFSLLTVVPFMVPALLAGGTPALEVIHTINAKFIFLVAILGLGASWLGFWLWSYSSRRLPSEISGLFLVSETLFALVYGYIYEGRLPRPLEFVAIVLITGAVTLAIFSMARSRKASSAV